MLGQISRNHLIHRRSPTMRIFVCDDSPQMAKKLAAIIEQQVATQGISASIDVVDREKDLCDLDYKVFDIAFLDIDMGACNGIDLARKLRAVRPDAVIVFVTNYIEYAPSGYGVNAFRYVLKSTMEETLPSVIALALDEYKKRHRVVSFSMASESIDVPVENILYLESNHRVIVMHLINHAREFFRFYASITQMEATLSPIGFLRVHKSYLVNMEYIESLQYGKVRLKGSVDLPVSKTNYTELKQYYIAWRGGHRWNIG